MIISSDGHAGARMADYRPYLDPEAGEFDGFLPDWDERGSRNFDPPALKGRLDPEFIDEWKSAMLDTGRVNGYVDPVERLKDVGEDGICAEVLFPDFGLPFELYGPVLPRRSVTPLSTNGIATPGTERSTGGWRTMWPPLRNGSPGWPPSPGTT